jgi:ribonuclease P protein component
MSKPVSLKSSGDFGRVYTHRKSFANQYLVMYILKNDLMYSRMGISVSKKVGNSVVRHRLTRLVRESRRLNMDRIRTGYDIVVVVRAAAKGKGFHDIEDAFLQLCGRHHLLADK